MKLHIFDLDNTLINTRKSYLYSYHQTSQQLLSLAPELAASLINQLLAIYGSSAKTEVFRALALIVGQPLVADLQKKLNDRFDHLYWQGLSLYPGAFEYLTKLQQQDCKLALITNGASAMQRTKLARLGLTDFFKPDNCMISSELGASKPDPLMIGQLLVNTKLSADQAVFYGDSLVDFLTAKQAQVDFVLYCAGGEQILPTAVVSKVINNWQELTKGS